jgi:uncharacterized membrane protein YgcG
MPPSAADFWGERAEAVQDVLQGPGPPPLARSEFELAAASTESHRPIPSRSVGGPLRPRPPWQTRLAAARHQCSVVLSRALAAVWHWHWRRLAAAGCAMAAVVGAAVLAAVAFESSPSRPRGSTTAARTVPKPHQHRLASASVPHIPAPRTGAKHRPPAHGSTRRARPLHPRHPAKGRRARSATTPARNSTPQRSSTAGSTSTPTSSSSTISSSPSTASGSGGSSGASSSSSSGSTSSSGASAAPPSSTSAHSASASQHSSGANPTGASGALGPIGSPNG